MLLKIESLINLLFVKLLEGKVNFYFVRSMIKLIENPIEKSNLEVVKFCKPDYENFGVEIENMLKTLAKFQENYLGYRKAILEIIANTLSNYSYTFKEKRGTLVQSSLIFLLMQKLPENEMKELMNFICERELQDVLCRPQICQSKHSYIFSSLMHYILERKWDDLALNISKNIRNKHLLFIKNIEGLDLCDIASKYNCPRCLEYLQKIKTHNPQIRYNVNV